MTPQHRAIQVTFQKRKNGLMKKAMELSKLCNCRIGLIIFDPNGKIYDFKTEDMTDLVKEYLTSDVHESNNVEDLYRKYNPKEAQSSAQFIIDEETKPDVFFGEVEKTDETVVDVDSNSDGNVDLRNPIDIDARIDKKRKIVSPKPGVNPDESSRRSAVPTTFARPPYPRSREAFPGLDPMFPPRFKEEPYSAASQQILRLEDNPPFFVHIPRQSEGNMYPMSVPGSGGLGRQDSMYLNNAASTGSIFICQDETKKFLDSCEPIKTPHLSSTLMTSGLLNPSELTLFSGRGFPYSDVLSDNPATMRCQQYQYEPQSEMPEATQGALHLHSLLRPSYYPPPSHNQS